MLMKAAPRFAESILATPPFLPPHLLGWAIRMFALYLGAAVTAMVAGTGVLYVGHLVQPPDQWPDFRPVAHMQPASHVEAAPGVVQAPRLEAPAVPVASLGRAEPFPVQLADAPIGKDEPDAPGHVIDGQELRRGQLLRAMRLAGFTKADGKSSSFTLFAPSDGGLERLLSNAAQDKLHADGKASLRQLLAGHAVAGDYSLERLRSRLKQPGDHVTLHTVGGGVLIVTSRDESSILVRDAWGREVAMAAAPEQPKDGLHFFDQVGQSGNIDAGSR